MKMNRRIGAIVAMAVAALTMSSVAAATPAAAHGVNGPQPTSALLQTVNDNQPTWVKVWWKTDRPICDARVRVWGNPRVDIDYPTSTGTYSSFSRSGMLRPHERDFTSFRVTAHYDRRTWVMLPATISFTHCGGHTRMHVTITSFLLLVRSPSLVAAG